MKIISLSALDIIVALLAVKAVTAFVPNSCSIGHRAVPTQALPASTSAAATATTTRATTVCFAREVDTTDTDETTSASNSSPVFPFSDRQVRFAYDEWRLVYGKGEYDAERFKSFQTNHRTLVISNLKARDKAAQEGRPMPQWMSLNEYGDYSLDEYEAMMRGEQPAGANANDDPSMAYSSSNDLPFRGTLSLHSEEDSMNYDNGQVGEYQDQFGRTIRSTQAVTTNQDASLETAAMNVDTNYANTIDDYDGDENSRKTLFIPKGEDDDNNNVQISSQRGTKVIGTNSAQQTRGTQVIASANAAGASYGTQVINGGGGSYGTQVVNGGGGSYGTQAVNGGGGSYGTQALSSDSSESYDMQDGTQIIPKNEGGTLIIPKSDSDGSDEGTQLIPTSSDTKDVDKDNEKGSLSKLFGGLFGDSENYSEDDDEDIGKRGTMVIKRSIKAPEQKSNKKNPFSLFGSSSKKEEEEEEEVIEVETEASNGSNFFGFLSPKDDKSTVTETAANEQEDESKTGGGGIFSLFGGTVKSSSNPRPVRTSISLQKGKKRTSTGYQSRRETKLIPDEIESENGIPSILSFFGGAKKVDEEETARNPNSRPTLIVKKPKTFQDQFSSLFSGSKESTEAPSVAASNASASGQNPVIAAQVNRQKNAVQRAAERRVEVAKEREAKRLEREQKRLTATQRREAQARSGGTKAVTTNPKAQKKTTTSSSPFAFFGAMGKKAEPPTLQKWRQNRDGTLSGLIYDSKNFEDGTRITTSPVPRGAKKGTVVKTDGGSKYSLT